MATSAPLPTPGSAPRKGDDPLDPRGLIAEAYRLTDPAPEACRAIFFDWALGRTEAEGAPDSVRALHARYAALAPDHPMTAVLAEGAVPSAGRRRRRG